MPASIWMKTKTYIQQDSFAKKNEAENEVKPYLRDIRVEGLF
jgi:hypothetical protein